MRVSNRLIFDTVVNNMQRSANKLLKSHEILSSGKKITRPSDDPISFSQILRYKNTISDSDQYLRNIDQGISFLELSDSSLSHVDNLIIRARELAVAQSNDIFTAEDRLVVSEEIDNIFKEMVQIANTRLGDRYIFGGFLDNTSPFDSNGGYNGDSGVINIDIGPNARISINIPGDQIFKATGTGTIDIFTVLSDLKTALDNNDVTEIRNAIDKLDTALTQVTNNRAKIGTRINRMENTKADLDTYKLNIEGLRSNIEDVDIAKAVSDIILHQSVLEASQASTSRVISSSLLNFLR